MPNEPDVDTLSYWLQRLEPLIRVELDKEVIVVFCNRCGMEGDQLYTGTSAIVGIKNGEVNVYGLCGRGVKGCLIVDTENPPYAKLIQIPSLGTNQSGEASHGNIPTSPSTEIITSSGTETARSFRTWRTSKMSSPSCSDSVSTHSETDSRASASITPDPGTPLRPSPHNARSVAPLITDLSSPTGEGTILPRTTPISSPISFGAGRTKPRPTSPKLDIPYTPTFDEIHSVIAQSRGEKSAGTDCSIAGSMESIPTPTNPSPVPRTLRPRLAIPMSPVTRSAQRQDTPHPVSSVSHRAKILAGEVTIDLFTPTTPFFDCDNSLMTPGLLPSAFPMWPRAQRFPPTPVDSQASIPTSPVAPWAKTGKQDQPDLRVFAMKQRWKSSEEAFTTTTMDGWTFPTTVRRAVDGDRDTGNTAHPPMAASTVYSNQSGDNRTQERRGRSRLESQGFLPDAFNVLPQSQKVPDPGIEDTIVARSQYLTRGRMEKAEKATQEQTSITIAASLSLLQPTVAPGETSRVRVGARNPTAYDTERFNAQGPQLMSHAEKSLHRSRSMSAMRADTKHLPPSNVRSPSSDRGLDSWARNHLRGSSDSFAPKGTGLEESLLAARRRVELKETGGKSRDVGPVVAKERRPQTPRHGGDRGLSDVDGRFGCNKTSTITIRNSESDRIHVHQTEVFPIPIQGHRPLSAYP